MIRKALLTDVKSIHKIISGQARHGHVLARAMTDLYAQIRDFTVIVDDSNGEIVGCGALRIVWEDLAEIRSVAVRSSFQKSGLGSQLIEALIDEADSMAIKRVFVLTYRVSFFERLGFEQMDKNLLPHKIWADCINCPKFPECDEIAMVRNEN